jgi:glutamate synthase (NADPH/NADH) small chain
MPHPARLPAERAETAIATHERAWGTREVLLEAQRCLYCHNAPCSRGCPAGVDVPEFIRSLRTGAWKAAARLVLSANALAETCGCVCPTEMLCVGECVLPRIDGQAPIAIHRLQRFIANWARTRATDLFPRQPDTGMRVALVGGGPASIACAHELARRGHAAVIFESGELLGGLSTAAIAPHKMHAELPLAEAEWLLRAGVEVRARTAVGEAITFAQLEDEYDAIFIGVGQGPDRRLGLAGEDARPLLGAIDFLRGVKTGRLATPLPWKRALCVGGGNSAIDAARTLKELGVPEVVLVYRRAEDQMKGYPGEWQAAKLAGVRAHFLTLPVAVLASEGTVTGLRCIRMTPGEPDESGRPRPVPVPGSEHDIACDLVIMAVGQVGAGDLLPGLPDDIRLGGARIAVSPETGATSRAGYYAGGDCANGGAEVVNAAAEGLRAGRAIDDYLRTRAR